MSTFSDLVLAHRQPLAIDTASKILRSLNVSKSAADVLLPVITHAVATAERTMVRTVERRSPVDVPALATTGWAWAPRINLLINCGGRLLTWGEATVDDHSERIVGLSKMRDGLDRTTTEHERAIDEITAANVKCLNDLAPAPKPSKPTPYLVCSECEFTCPADKARDMHTHTLDEHGRRISDSERAPVLLDQEVAA